MTGVIILAAGSSSRLGTPKQNLVYKGHTLLQKAINAAKTSVCKPVVVVLGANAEHIRPTIKNLPISLVYNPGWQEGMASSIRTGIVELQKIEPAIDAIILMLCDQPFADVQLINELVQAKLNKGIVASSYNTILGVPALFDKVYFPELLQLKGHEGAKKLLIKYRSVVSAVPFEQGGVDIDTTEDFEQLNK